MRKDRGGLPQPAHPWRHRHHNTEGFVHYSMLPNLLHDLKQIGVNPQDMSPLFNSAEAFATTWTKVVQRARDVR